MDRYTADSHLVPWPSQVHSCMLKKLVVLSVSDMEQSCSVHCQIRRLTRFVEPYIHQTQNRLRNLEERTTDTSDPVLGIHVYTATV